MKGFDYVSTRSKSAPRVGNRNWLLLDKIRDQTRDVLFGQGIKI